MAFEGARRKVQEFLADESGAGKPPSTEGAKRALRAGVLGAGITAGILSMHGNDNDPRPTAIEQEDRQGLTHLIEKIEGMPVQSFGREYFTEDELKCLTDNVYHEARGEEPKGQYAVMFATLGRALNKKYPKSICGVVHQPTQFSWTTDKNVLAQPINPRDYLKIAIEVHGLMQGRDIHSAALEAGLRAGLPHGAIYYKVANFTGSKRVEKFFSRLQRVASIGNHDFYIEKHAPKKQAHPEKTAHPRTAPLPAPSPRHLSDQAGRNHAG